MIPLLKRLNHKTVQIKTVTMLLQKLTVPEMTLNKRNQLLKTPPRTKQKLRKLKSQQMKHKARKRAKMQRSRELGSTLALRRACRSRRLVVPGSSGRIG